MEVDIRGNDVVICVYRVQGEYLRLHMFASGQVMPATVVKPNKVSRKIDNSSQGAG
jgi:hypothetical protein